MYLKSSTIHSMLISLPAIFRLFLGSDRVLNITSIRIIQTNINLKTYIGAITALDSIISGNLSYSNPVSEDSKHCRIIKNLFNHASDAQLSSLDKIKILPYIMETFKTLIQHKEKIDVNIPNVHLYMKEKNLLELLFDDLVRDGKEDIGSWIQSDAKTNLLKPAVFQIFHNVKELHIDARYYPFSLSEFLSRIQDTSIDEVSIDIGNKDLAGSNWKVIQDQYKEQQFDIDIHWWGINIKKC